MQVTVSKRDPKKKVAASATPAAEPKSFTQTEIYNHFSAWGVTTKLTGYAVITETEKEYLEEGHYIRARVECENFDHPSVRVVALRHDAQIWGAFLDAFAADECHSIPRMIGAQQKLSKPAWGPGSKTNVDVLDPKTDENKRLWRGLKGHLAKALMTTNVSPELDFGTGSIAGFLKENSELVSSTLSRAAQPGKEPRSFTVEVICCIVAALLYEYQEPALWDPRSPQEHERLFAGVGTKAKKGRDGNWPRPEWCHFSDIVKAAEEATSCVINHSTFQKNVLWWLKVIIGMSAESYKGK